MDGYIITTKYWKVVLVEEQAYLGRLSIKTIRQCTSLPDLSQKEQEDFFCLIKDLETFFTEKIGATMFNYTCLMNNAYRDNITPHVHFHFRPRYKNPITIFGYTYTDQNFGEHYINSNRVDKEKSNIPEEVRNYIKSEMISYFSNK